MKHWLLAAFAAHAIAGSVLATGANGAVIYSFQGGSDGSYPYGGLLAGPGGLYPGFLID